jgi:multidrug efflux pump subunit AcrB
MNRIVERFARLERAGKRGIIRFRPIMMTTMAAQFGCVPDGMRTTNLSLRLGGGPRRQQAGPKCRPMGRTILRGTFEFCGH